MVHPDFIVSNSVENSFGLKKVNQESSDFISRSYKNQYL